MPENARKRRYKRHHQPKTSEQTHYPPKPNRARVGAHDPWSEHESQHSPQSHESGTSGEQSGTWPDWDTAVSTLSAIEDIVDIATVVDKGYAYPRWHPSHHPEVPERYQSLLHEWLLITHGRVELGDGISVTIRGEMLKEHIQQALAKTMPLVLRIQQDADPESLGSLNSFLDKVIEFRHRATAETIGDAVEAGSHDAIQRGDSPVDHLRQDNQLKLASTQLISVARALTSASNRVAGANKLEAELAMKQFDSKLNEAELPEGLKQQLASAKSLADVASHINSIANGIQGVLSAADPELQRRAFHAEFGRYGIETGVDVLKAIGGLVQGSVAVYGVAGYALLRARGLHAEATKLFAASSARLSGGIGTAVNALSVVHGAFMVLTGETATDKMGGAVESTVGALAIAAKYGKEFPALGQHAGPLAAALTVSWTTLNWLGEKTIGALYGMIQLGLNEAYKDLREHTLELNGEATRLAIMMEMAPSDPDQRIELQKQLATGVSLLGGTIRSYVQRTQVAGRDRDPGTWDAFRIRFAPLVGVPLKSEFDVLAAAQQFTAISVGCFQNSTAVLEESVQQSVREHGEANKHRF